MMDGLMTKGKDRESAEVPMIKKKDTETFWKTPSMDQSLSACVVTGNCQEEILLFTMRKLNPRSSSLWQIVFLTWISTPMLLNLEMAKKFVLTTGKKID